MAYCTSCGNELNPNDSFCPTCGSPIQKEDVHVPIRLDVQYPEELSRVLLFFKWLFAIPVFIVVGFYGLAAFIVTFIAFWVILISGRYPEGMFNFVRDYQATSFRLIANFPLLFCDRWAPQDSFTDPHPLKYEADHPESLSRLLLLLKLVLFILSGVSTVYSFVYVYLFFLSIPAWFVILGTGKYPRGLFMHMIGVFEWVARITAWDYLMRDDFSLFGTTQAVKVTVGIAVIVSSVLGLLNFL